MTATPRGPGTGSGERLRVPGSSLRVSALSCACWRPAVLRVGQASSTPRMTSVALMNTVTARPSASPRRSAEERVIAATISWPSTSTVTSAITAPSSTLRTMPLSWLRALSFTISSLGYQADRRPSLRPRAGRDAGCQLSRTEVTRRGRRAVRHRVALGPVEVDVGTLAGQVADVQEHGRNRVGHGGALHPQDAVAVPLFAGHLQPGLELRWVRHRDLQEQHRVVGGDLVAHTLLVLLLQVLQDVPGVGLVGDDPDLTCGGCLLDEP